MARTLPPVELIFEEEGASGFVTYEAKWREDSAAYRSNRVQFPADLCVDQRTGAIAELAKHAFRVLGCRHLATVDFRLDLTGNPHILEVNPNPNLKPTSCFVQELGRATYLRVTLFCSA